MQKTLTILRILGSKILVGSHYARRRDTTERGSNTQYSSTYIGERTHSKYILLYSKYKYSRDSSIVAVRMSI